MWKKSFHIIQFKLGVYTNRVSAHIWFAFWPGWPNFGPVVSTTWLKMVVSDHNLEKYSRNPIPTRVYTYLLSVQNWYAFWQRWRNFGPLVATKLLKLVVFDRYREKYSRNPIQTLCTRLLGEFSEQIRSIATFAKFGPSSGHKITENGSFRPLCWKLSTQSNSNTIPTLIEWVFRNYLLFGHIGKTLAL